MAYKYSFADNEIYSAEDLNSITKRLVTSGITDSFEDGVAYNVSRLNEQGNLLYTSGVVPETCLTLKVVSDSEGKILINPGKAFFNDGAVIEIEAGGESLSYITGAKNYVYLKNDLQNSNICYPCCTTDAPTGDYVMLAEIDETGEISDKRTYARGKLPGYQSVTGNVMNIKDKIQIVVGGSSEEWVKTYDLGANNFHKIISAVWAREREYSTIGVYDIENDTYLSCRSVTPGSGDEEAKMSCAKFYIASSSSGNNYTYLIFSISDGLLTIEPHFFNTVIDKYENGEIVEYDIDLILF